MDDFLPYIFRIYRLYNHWIIGIDRILLHEVAMLDNGFHEVVGNFHRNVCSCNLAGYELCVDEVLAVGVLDRNAEHKGAASSVLSHLACGVGVAFHKRHDSRRSKSRVLHRRTGRTQMRQVVTNATSTLHQLNLFLVDAHDATVRVGKSFVANYKAVRQRNNLLGIADSRHRAALRNNIFEVLEQVEENLFVNWIGVIAVNSCQFGCNTMVHIVGSPLVEVPVRILKCVLRQPYACCQLVATEIFLRCLLRIVHLVCLLLFHFYIFFGSVKLQILEADDF